MKTYKMADLLKKDHKTLNEDLAKLTAELNQIRVKALSRKSSDDSSNAGKMRKQIARLKTAINQPEQVKKTEKVNKEQVK